ncbi:hypothetical protein ATN84_20845 [Paramesorhizobium deserti]|uniref:Hrp-dependent type III effector protein n=1 Tax=Paramesorhizobium deserti TaxID=1494590 RepID=A0A135HPQ5_9HYPH|nr:four-carbon acid sugar kinase family protein [Paramesorhizobium deserti]KXF75126.1 hypothetical protein ATN84_20845 [Paramesorhizobium deserti]
MVSVNYVFIGDDFTGASDTLATLARAGRRVRLFLAPPDPGAIAKENLDAIGFATEFRALAPDAIAAGLDALAPVLKVLSPRILHYKVCSTFDSSPDIGSIGRAVSVLEHHLAPALVAVVGGQPSLGRYCAFGNLFARGPHGQVHRIDRHPVMRNHPVTPMTEADLRHHLAKQGLEDLRLIALPVIKAAPTALAAHLEDLMRAGERHILFDACSQAHLATIGSALVHFGNDGRPLLVIGASSVAEALTAGEAPRVAQSSTSRKKGKDGPCLVIAGSRSEITAAQVRAALGFKRMPIRPMDLSHETIRQRFIAHCVEALAAGDNVLAHLVPDEDYGLNGADLARKLANLAAAILDRQAVRALGIAGGDTSSILVRRLGFSSLAFENQLDDGVAICTARSADPQRDGTRLMLKGGQVGSETVFDRFMTTT